MTSEANTAPAPAGGPATKVTTHRLGSGGLFAVAFFTVGLAGLLAATVTWAFHPAAPKPCVAHCPPPRLGNNAAESAVSALAEQRTYRSSAAGFSVDYPANWSVRDQAAAGVLLATRAGLFEVVSVPASSGTVALFQQRLSSFGSALPDIKDVGPLRGAHVGSQIGQGELYSGTVVPSSGGGQGVPVRIGLIVARRGGKAVRVMALLPFDESSGKIQGSSEVDYALSEFRWPGE